MAGKLTARGVESLAKRKGRFGDGDGLFLRVLDPGRRIYWVYRFRLNGVDRETSIGGYPAMSLAEARDKHLDLRKLVKDKVDPLGDRRAKGVVAKAGVPTFGQLALDHVEVHESSWRSAKHRQQWRQTFTSYCDAIWRKPVDEIATADVLACLKPIWTTKTVTAGRLRGRIETIIDAAQALGHIDPNVANPARWRGHLQRLLPKPAKLTRGHHAAMSYGSVAEFAARLRQIDSVTSLALEFLILTATRTNETLGARWQEFDLEARTWSIPKERTKVDEAFSVPLSDRALAILAEAQSRARKELTDESYVFPGVRPKRPLSPMALVMLMRRMGVKDATVHGFRTTFRVWASEVFHAEFEIAEAALSHRVGSAVSRAYNRTSLLERRRPLMLAWSDFVTGEADDKVVPLRRAGT